MVRGKFFFKSNREGGEVKPKRPTVGKVKPGIMICQGKHGRYSETTNRVNETMTECVGNIEIQIADGQHNYAPNGVTLVWFPKKGNCFRN
jgi:hypothetical protein